jgi:hypothetical protein
MYALLNALAASSTQTHARDGRAASAFLTKQRGNSKMDEERKVNDSRVNSWNHLKILCALNRMPLIY